MSFFITEIKFRIWYPPGSSCLIRLRKLQLRPFLSSHMFCSQNQCNTRNLQALHANFLTTTGLELCLCIFGTFAREMFSRPRRISLDTKLDGRRFVFLSEQSKLVLRMAAAKLICHFKFEYDLIKQIVCKCMVACLSLLLATRFRVCSPSYLPPSHALGKIEKGYN